MKEVIYKWFWAWDADKEEKWLNEMAAKGLILSSICYCRYEFEKGVPGEYNIRLELLERLPGHVQSRQYISFLEEVGVEHVGSNMRWIYFRKKASDGEFEIYSDMGSRIEQLNRILVLISIPFIFNLYIGIWNFTMFLAKAPEYSGFSILNLLLAVLCGYGCLKINKKKQKLKKERQLFE